ncbi:hypothetical protein ACMYSQ_012287 [Aspergillus niger]
MHLIPGLIEHAAHALDRHRRLRVRRDKMIRRAEVRIVTRDVQNGVGDVIDGDVFETLREAREGAHLDAADDEASEKVVWIAGTGDSVADDEARAIDGDGEMVRMLVAQPAHHRLGGPLRLGVAKIVAEALDVRLERCVFGELARSQDGAGGAPGVDAGDVVERLAAAGGGEIEDVTGADDVSGAVFASRRARRSACGRGRGAGRSGRRGG